jgi:hypothetical protein
MTLLNAFVNRRALLIGGLLLMLLPLMVAYGQSDGIERWSSPQEISRGWWQSVTLDNQGYLHMAWYDSAASSDGVSRDTLWYSRRSPDGTWTTPNNVIYTAIGGYTVRNALAVTNDGMLYVVLRAGVQHFVAGAYGLLADNAARWSKGHVIDDNGYYVDMQADDANVLHVVASGWVDVIKPKLLNAEASPCALCYDLFYRRSTDGGNTWSNPVPFSIDPNTGADRVNIFRGSERNLYVTWDEGADWYVGRGAPKDVRIAHSSDGGLSWSAPLILDGGANLDRRPIQLIAAEIRGGGLLVVWRYSTDFDRKIYYQVTQDMKTWTPPQPIPGLVARELNDTPLDMYELQTDRQGRIHLFAAGQPNENSRANAALYHVIYQQGIWLAPQRVFYDPSMRPEWPKAAIGPSNDIHLSWFVRGIRENQQLSNEDFTRDLRVYYSHLPGNLSEQPLPTFAPTLTPLPSATPFQFFESTSTPQPTVRPIENVNETPMQTADNYAMQVLLGGALFALVFCAGILVMLRYRR